HILTSENKKAVINVSESVPIVTSQQLPIGGAVPTGGTTTAVVGTQSVEYRDAGVVLTVTPRIGEHGTVALDVKQEVNEIGTKTPPTDSLSIIKREAETSVVLINNQTLVLGGLIQDKITLDDRASTAHRRSRTTGSRTAAPDELTGRPRRDLPAAPSADATHRPVNLGGRLSKMAATPSRWSSEAIASPCEEASASSAPPW